MSYQPGKMGIAEGIGLVFFLTFTDVFLSIWSISVDRVKTAAWLTPLIGGACVLIAFFALLVVMKRFPEKDILEVAEILVGKAGCWLIGLYLSGAFFLEGMLQLRQFADNTLLTSLPNMDFSVIILFYIIVVTISLYFSIEPLARLSYIVLPFALTGLLLAGATLSPDFNLLNLTPWQGGGLTTVLPVGIILSGLGMGVMIVPILARSFQDLKTMKMAVIYGFSLSTVTRSILLLVFTLVFGVMVGREKVLPFYEMTRIINISRFLQRLESLFIILWVISGLIAITVNFFAAIYILVRLFKLPTMKPLIALVSIIVVQIIMLPPDIVTVIGLHNKAIIYIDTGAVLGVPLVLLLGLLVKRRRKSVCVAD
jgi:spore germination protein (amino acid permease)